MLILFVLSLLSLLIFNSNRVSLVFLLLGMLFYYLLNLNMFFNSSIYMIGSYWSVDELALFISLLSFFIIFMSYIYSLPFNNYGLLSLTLLSLLFFCLQVFCTNNLFMIYFFYEASLLPILFIIVNWGAYPERSLSAITMLFYTLFFSAPFLLILMFVFYCFDTFSIDIINTYITFTPLVLSLVIFATFAVKLPIYGLHQWLPIAHVEAPTFGSVILASLLLNLGGVGMIRVFILINVDHLSSCLIGYLMVFIVFSSLVCCFQSDMKRLIAYSSVAHMILIPLLIIACNVLSLQTLTIVILFHGLSSSLLFMLVGVLYSIYSTRQLILIRGLLLVSPLLGLISILAFFFTISAPPFPSFVAEVYFIISTYILTDNIIYVFILFAFISMLYNLNWLSSVLFGPTLPIVHTESMINYSLFIPLALILVNSFFVIFMFICF